MREKRGEKETERRRGREKCIERAVDKSRFKQELGQSVRRITIQDQWAYKKLRTKILVVKSPKCRCRLERDNPIHKV